MNGFFVFVTGSTVAVELNCSLGRSLDRYMKYTIGRTDHSVSVFISEDTSSYIDCLKNSCRFLAGIKGAEMIGFQAVNLESNDETGKSHYDCISFSVFLDDIKALFDCKMPASLVKYILNEELKIAVFKNIVSEFAHASNMDMVNSDAGLLKIWCDNMSLISNENIDLKIDHESVKHLINEFTERFRKISDDIKELISGEIYYILYNSEKILELTKKVKKGSATSKEAVKLSERLGKLFDLISRYKD
jgi:hypothetical protein